MKGVYLFLFLGFCSLISKGQNYEVTHPVTRTSDHSEMTVIVVRNANDGPFLFEESGNFELESELSGQIEFELRISTDKKVLNIVPLAPYILGDRITVKDKLGKKLCVFTIRHKKLKVTNSTFVQEQTLLTKAIPSYIIDVNTTTSTQPIFFRNSGNPGDRHIGIIYSDGTEIFSQLEDQVQNFDLQPSGYLSYYDKVDKWFLLLDSAYTIVDTIKGNSGYTADFHELVHLPNGNSLIMCEDLQVMDLTGYGGLINTNVFGNILQIQDANGVLLFNWRSWDHINLGETVMSLSGTNVDYAHINSMEYDLDGHLIASARNMNQVFKINSIDGSFIWRLGGSLGTLTFQNDTNGLSLQHDARILPNGNLTVFDNGVSHDPPIASAKEYTIDTALGTANLVWNFSHPYGAASGRTGNAQRLPNGNTFINWGSREADILNPNFTEVTASGNIVFQFRFSSSANYSCYRARRHSWDLSTSIPNQTNYKLLVYPNPVDNFLIIRPPSGLSISKIDILDITGNNIKTCEMTNRIDVSELSPGAYLIRSFLKDGIIIGKFIKG